MWLPRILQGAARVLKSSPAKAFAFVNGARYFLLLVQRPKFPPLRQQCHRARPFALEELRKYSQASSDLFYVSGTSLQPLNFFAQRFYSHYSTIWSALSHYDLSASHKSVAYILNTEGISIDVHIDDFYGAESTDSSDLSFQRMNSLFAELGLMDAPEKDSPPSHEMLCLRIWINTLDMTLSLPAFRVA